jgi:flagellar biosynthesis protein FliR
MAITQNRNAIANANWLLRMYDSFATVPVVNSVKPVSNVRSIAAKGLQGIVIGLFVGVLVALLFDWRSRSSNA